MNKTAVTSTRRFAWPLVTIALIDSFVYGTVAPVFPFFGRAAGLGYSQTSILAAFFAVGAVASLPLRLWLLRHITPRQMILLGAATGAAAHLFFAPLMSTPVLFGLRFLHGFASGMLWMGILGVVIAARRDNTLTAFGLVFGLVMGTYGIGNMVGPMSGFLPSPELTFQILGAAHLLALGIGLLIPRTSHAVPRISLRGFGHPQVRAGLISGAISGAGLGLLVAAYPLFFAETMSSWQIGVIYAAAAIPGVLLAPYAGRRLQQDPSPVVLLAASAILLITIGLIATAPWMIWWILLLVAARTLFTMLQTGSVTAMVADGPNATTYVFATAIWGIVFDIGYSVAPAIASSITEATTFHVGTWAAVVTLLLAIAAAWWLSERLRPEGRPSPT